MALGADASVQHIADNLAAMMKLTGASNIAPAVQNETDLKRAAKGAALWFQGKSILFLFDDVWPSKTCTKGYLPELRSILQGCPDSRIAITTRSLSFGESQGSHVEIAALDRIGSDSASIFTKHGTSGSRSSL